MYEKKSAWGPKMTSYAPMCGNGGNNKLTGPHEGSMGRHEII